MIVAIQAIFMKTYSSTWKTFWQHDLRGPWLSVVIMFIPLILGYFLTDWAFFREGFAYKILILSSVIAATRETFFARRVIMAVIDESNRTIRIDYLLYGSVRQVQLPFRTTRVELRKKKIPLFRSMQWVAFEDHLDRTYRITAGRNGFTKEVVQDLIRHLESVTHPSGYTSR